MKSNTFKVKFAILVATQIALLAACSKDPIEPVEISSNELSPNVISCIYTQQIDGVLEICKTHNQEHSTLTTSNGKDKWWPKHSPVSNEILFYQSNRTRDINDYSSASLWMINTSGGLEELIPQGAFGWDKQGQCNWSHDGSSTLMAAVDSAIGTWQVYITDANGENPARITKRNEVDYFDPIFNLDDRTILCSTVPEGEDMVNSNIEIVRIDIISGEEERLTFNKFRDHHPDISPDGNTILFESLVDPDYLSIGKWAIKEMNLSSMAEYVLIEDNNINLFPKYSQSGELIYLTELNIETFQMNAVVYSIVNKQKSYVIQTENITMNPDPI